MSGRVRAGLAAAHYLPYTAEHFLLFFFSFMTTDAASVDPISVSHWWLSRQVSCFVCRESNENVTGTILWDKMPEILP